MDPLESLAALDPIPPATGTGRRIAWHAIGMVLAATVAWLIFIAYRQPELMLDLAGMRLC